MASDMSLPVAGRQSPLQPEDLDVLDQYGVPFGANCGPYVKQGKVAELRQELTAGGKKDKNHSAKKIALKKIVANMTMSNNDMVALFPDIINCMQIPSLEIKKMYVSRNSFSALTQGPDNAQVLSLFGQLLALEARCSSQRATDSPFCK